MAKQTGKTTWAIAEGCIPARSTGPQPQMTGHETVCLLDCGDRDGRARLLPYFVDREPVRPYRVTVAAAPVRHLRFNDFSHPPVVRETDYATVVTSDVPVVVQHTRLNSRQAHDALLSTIAYSE